jgi:hypothetical protein
MTAVDDLELEDALAFERLAPGARTVTHVQVLLDDVDVTCHAFAPLSVAWGRDHPGDSFEPRRATLTFDDIAQPKRGQTMVAVLQDPTANPTWANTAGKWNAQVGTWQSKRVDIVVFRGKVTDVSIQWLRIHVDREAKQRWGALYDVTAVDPMAELANLIVGDTPWPQETISQRAARIQALTPLAWTTEGSAALVAARDVDAQPAYDMLDDLAHQGSLAGGLFYDPNAKVAKFLLGASRTSLVPGAVIDACSISSDAQSSVSAVDVVNDVAVTYVNPADASAQPTARYVNVGSVNTYGRRARSISTQLVTPADATARAQGEASRYGLAIQSWQNVKVGTAYGSTSAALAKSLLLAIPGLRTQLTVLPKPSTPTWDGYLEGWALEVDAVSWAVELQLSPAQWSGPLLTWADVVPTKRWVDVVKPLTWIDATAALPQTVTEPGFENWTGTTTNPDYPDGYPIGWTVFWIIGARKPVRKGPAHDGATGLSWGPTTAAGQAQRLISEPAWAVVPGATIAVGLWVKSADAAHLATIELDVMTAPHSNPAPFAANTTNQAALAPTVTTAAWVFYSGTVVVPAGHYFAKFSPVLSAAASGATCHIDTAQAQ